MASIPSVADIEYQIQHSNDNAIPSIIAANAVCLTIGCVSVALRFLARRVAKVKYAADDWLIVAGLIFTLGTVIIFTIGLRYGSGRHSILLKHPATFAKLLLSGEVIWGFAITTIKCSILYLYYRVFFVSRSFKYILLGTGIFVICYCLVQSFASVLACLPVSSFWDVTKPHRCVKVRLGATIISAFNVLTDFVIILLPMPLLCKMHRPLKQKLEIMGIFLLGGLVCFASLYRCIVTYQVSYTDPAWGDVRTAIWTLVELNIGILSACLPTMRPLFTRRKGSKVEYSGPEQRSGKSTGGISEQTLRNESGSASGQGQEKGSVGGDSDQSLTPLQPDPNLNLSKEFARGSGAEEENAKECV